MRILLVHNYYQQPGGEDVVFRAERDMLRAAGHELLLYERHNDEISDFTPARRLGLFRRTTWAKDSYHDLKALAASHRPDIAHFHNTFPLISPAGWYACGDLGIPVVQTLHNYRTLCLNAQLFRKGGVCESCVGRTPWPGVLRGCYRGSRTQSLAVAAMLTAHRRRRTYRHAVDVYIALTEFARRKFIEGGLPAERITVKPNFVTPDPGPRQGRGDYALFVGRLSREKGIDTLLEAWRQLEHIPLRIVGDGPLAEVAGRTIGAWPHKEVELLGRLPAPEVMRLIKGARYLIFPSLWYEGFPMTLAEAFACGVPAVASRLGGTAEIVEDGSVGRLFEPGDPRDLARIASELWSDVDQAMRLGSQARRRYEERYSPNAGRESLMKVYELARTRRAAETSP